ncbi:MULTISPECIES: nucleoid occlusion factor SlmA [Aliivibrio]|uniref:Nucleoid occlusion factor SlmA n=1 Tax=Aliivibrio sifiae TaxID=566293 RepID=A0A2S7X5I8_9GAMM|nr:nucleoid occlusion factor SlmA [Aliivibrio sifiae]PQJ85442.1 nucleoid occlusion factor SlmA [Aliivibrio sifiae]GLR76375.1 nucleoid occlusion factor SlmA [Aliivibrio sifiae]
MTTTKKTNRRDEILQALAEMLESNEGASRITTAKLAKQVGVSEAALYRHFPSKAKMFEGLIEFIEESLFSRINRIIEEEKDTLKRIELLLKLLLAFAERNPGLTRIMTGHALMFENERLRNRINQIFERIELQFKQILRERMLREGKSFPVDEAILSAQLISQVEGCFCRFVRSDFKYQPTANFNEHWALLSAQIQ